MRGSSPHLLDQLWDDLDPDDAALRPHELREDGAEVPAAGADVENLRCGGAAMKQAVRERWRRADPKRAALGERRARAALTFAPGTSLSIRSSVHEACMCGAPDDDDDKDVSVTLFGAQWRRRKPFRSECRGGMLRRHRSSCEGTEKQRTYRLVVSDWQGRIHVCIFWIRRGAVDVVAPAPQAARMRARQRMMLRA